MDICSHYLKTNEFYFYNNGIASFTQRIPIIEVHNSVFCRNVTVNHKNKDCFGELIYLPSQTPSFKATVMSCWSIEFIVLKLYRIRSVLSLFTIFYLLKDNMQIENQNSTSATGSFRKNIQSKIKLRCIFEIPFLHE